MTRTIFLAAALATAATFAGMVSLLPAQARAAKPHALSASAKRGLDVAAARCAACHAVAPGMGSPNPEAPPFEAVANQRGLSGKTLRQFLRDSHNYPAVMDFEIDRAVIGDLANYIVTLKSDTHRPDI